MNNDKNSAAIYGCFFILRQCINNSIVKKTANLKIVHEGLNVLFS
ncbi:hypothetical protein FM106_01085 [Brachybacterium faecium]|nr:hypothetical protein FM106_01085 [Brachybacterium faecium]